MIFNEFQKLVDKAGSRYGLVIAVTKRARDLKEGEGALVNIDSSKTVSVATKEMIDKKIKLTNKTDFAD